MKEAKIIFPLWQRLIVTIEDGDSKTDVYKRLMQEWESLCYESVTKNLNAIKNRGLIKFSKSGRKKIIKIESSGMEARKYIRGLKRLLE